MSSKIRIQYFYFSRLRRQLGLSSALRARVLTWLNARLGTRWLVRLKPNCVLYPVMLRPGTTDADTYYQVLIEQQYSIVPDMAPKFIVDCGANAGYTSAYFLSRFPTAQVIAIEPSGDNAALCRQNLAPYGNRAKVLEAAIWSCSDRLILEATAGEEWGVKVRSAGSGETGTVAAIGISDLALPRIDLLKVDIEGSEAELFRHGVETWLPRVGAIVIELHGPDCEVAFTTALSKYDFEWEQKGELSLAIGLRPKKPEIDMMQGSTHKSSDMEST